MVVRRLETAGGGRSKERERESPARGERLFEVVLWCERYLGTPVQLKSVSRWISDGTIMRL